MLTIDALRKYGADVEDGLTRCMNMEEFYLELVRSLTEDQRIYLLEEALKENDLDTAFEHAHVLKGMLANLSITPVLKPMEEMTEMLRSRTVTDYSQLYREAREQFDALCALV